MTPHISTEVRIEFMLTCAYGAVREHFSHLTIEEIIDPPRSFADAFLALHVATHILCEEFGVSRRKTAQLQMRFKGAVFRSLEQVRERCKEPVFLRAYQRIARRAADLYAAEMQRMAA